MGYINSKEFDICIGDYVESMVANCLTDIAKHMYFEEYTDSMAYIEEITDITTKIRNDIIDWLTNEHGLVESDGTNY